MNPITWAKRIKALDGNACAYCGASDNLQAHHIKPRSLYPEEAYSLRNGVTLCRPCHRAAHGGSFNGTGVCTPLEVDPEAIAEWLSRFKREG